MADRHSIAAREYQVHRQREFTIGDLSREFGITPRALRFYEAKGLICPRREGQKRLFSSSDRARLPVILKAKQLGFTLAEIKDMLARDSAPSEAGTFMLSAAALDEQIAHLERQKVEIEAALEELKAMRPGLGEAAKRSDVERRPLLRQVVL